MSRKIADLLFRFRWLLMASAAVIIVLGIAGVAFLALRARKPPASSSGTQSVPLNTGSTAASGAASFTTAAGTANVSIRLSAGSAQYKAAAPLPLSTGDPLTDAEIAAILKRLPDLPVLPGDQTDFKKAGDPMPPPRTGDKAKEPFPPITEAARPAVVLTGPLQVLRFAPEGEIPIAPFLSVTFNQPMVPLTTITELAARDVPVQLDPPLAGTWRWLGTKTLTFEYDSKLIDRLPKATAYRATIPAGLQSLSGGVLEKAVSWTFTTPPPKATILVPSGEAQPRDPLFFIGFDQRINPAAVLKTITVSAGGQVVSLKPVSKEEIAADKANKGLASQMQEGRWLAFKAVQLLPADAEVIVTIGPGTPSAEGPLTTPEPQTYRFRTYAPLKVQNQNCLADNPCQPLEAFYINFNNPLDAAAYTPSMVSIQPELPGASVDISYSSLSIRGASVGRTTYTVTIAAGLQDVYGQKLDHQEKLTFTVGPAQSVLVGPGQNFITLDPAAKKPVFTVYTINYARLNVTINAVQPSDWAAWTQYTREWQRTDIKVVMPGRQVFNKTLPVESAADTLSETDIDLSQVMDGKFGMFVVKVEPPQGLFKDPNAYYQTVQAWVQVTQIGLDAFNDQTEMVAWTTALLDGSPLAGVSLTGDALGQAVTTAKDGVARFAIPSGSSYLMAKLGVDTAMLPRTAWGESPWQASPGRDQLSWFVFDDRQMYKPGEDVHVKGWMRRIGAGQAGDVGLPSGLDSVSYQVTGPEGNQLGSGSAKVNALGAFDFAFTLPQQTNLGYANLQLTANGSTANLDNLSTSHSFQIQEFRRPEFEVKARSETPGPYFADQPATLAVDAAYYAGGGLPNADVTWQVTSSTGTYAPPNWPDFSFGQWTPWWWMGDSFSSRGYGGKGYYPGGAPTQKVETFTGKTDAAGTHYLRLDFNTGGATHPVSIQAEATVMDVNRQAWASTAALLVHPADLYIGLRSPGYFVERGTPLKIDFIVTDLDGVPVADRPVEIQAARLDWKTVGGVWQEVEANVQSCTMGSAVEPQTCTFQTPQGGTYRITATVKDDKGRQNQSQVTRWVSGSKQPAARQVEMETATLIPDKESYQPGDVAQILVQSPFSPAEGLLTVTRDGIVTVERFHIADGTATLKIPIKDEYIPNLNIQVDLTGAALRQDDQGNPLPDSPKRPAFASGQMTLRIPPVLRTLKLTLALAQAEVEPGGTTTLDVTVKDAAGQPVSGAELAVVVVDESILALTNYPTPDPLAAFYTDRYPNLASVYGRSSIILANPLALTAGGRQFADTAAMKSVESRSSNLLAGAPSATMAPAAAEAPGTGRGEGGAAPEPIRVRSDFNPLAVFSPSVTTGADGKAHLEIKVPDNLTRYRVMVVAVAGGKKFGAAEANLTARLPLMVRPSAPRFLNFGDQFELPVVVQNQTGAPLQVDVVVRTANLALTGRSGARLTIPAHDRLEVRFPAAAQLAGTARIQIAAVSGSYADAATVELPVYTPATSEAFATYGVIDNGAAFQPVDSPAGVFKQYGGLEITTSSTALQALTDAVLYLQAYRYECSEQLASRILSVAALRDVLSAFKAKDLPSPEAMQAAVQRDLTTLQTIQNEDGGFPYWRRGQDSSPFNTVHVAHALSMARIKGFAVDTTMLARTMDYLAKIETHYPAWYGKHTRWSLSAYALNVRNLAGDRDPQKALRLLDEAGLDGIGLDGIGWLWPVIQDAPAAGARLDEIRKYVNNHIVETAGAANFTTQYDDQNYLLLGSDRRTDAILLNALIGDNPKLDLIPKLVNGLLAHRTAGRWGSTQENVFVLLALDRYFNTFETQTPDFVARIWLGDTYAGSQTFQGRQTDLRQTDIPMAYLVDPVLGGGSTQNLILSKEGAGRLYYRLGLRYAPTDLNLKALDMGFTVQRVYEAVDNPADVRRDPDGTWHIKAGARVRVHLTMVATDRRYHVALADPLPAGLEIVNPALAVSGSTPQDPNSSSARYGWWWWGTWYEHQNLRDERAEAFTSLLWDGVYQYSYIARATTPGRFIVPPAKAEEMYSPEVFGRSASDVVIIE